VRRWQRQLFLLVAAGMIGLRMVQSRLGRISGSAGAREHFFLNVLYKILNLPLHLLHALAHLQDDGHAADFTPGRGKRKDKLQSLEIFIGIKASVPSVRDGFSILALVQLHEREDNETIAH